MKNAQKKLSSFLLVLLIATSVSVIIIPVSATDIWGDGVETNDYSAWTGTSGTAPAIVSSIAHSGTYSIEIDATAEYAYKSYTAGNDLYYQWWINLDDYPTNNWEYILFGNVLGNAGSVGLLKVGVIKNGAGANIWYMKYKNNTVETTKYSATTYSSGNWYQFVAYVNCSSSDGTYDGGYQFYVDGVELTDLAISNIDTDVTSSDRIFAGYSFNGATELYHLDDILVSDTMPVSGDTVSPTYSSLTASTTVSGASCNLNATFTDETDLTTTGGYILNFNGVNSTWTAFTSTPQTVSETVTLTNTVDASDTYNWYFNDTAGNWNTTGAQTITLTADTYTVTLTPSSTSLYRDETVTINIAVTRATGTAVTSWKLNITRSGGLVFENYTESSFTSSESSDALHMFNCTGLYDVTSAASVTPTCAGATVEWSGSAVHSSTGDDDTSATPSPSPTATPDDTSWIPSIIDEIPPIKQEDAAIVVGVLIVSVAAVTLYHQGTFTQKKKLSKNPKRKPLPKMKKK
jgi:hypothetical protein